MNSRQNSSRDQGYRCFFCRTLVNLPMLICVLSLKCSLGPLYKLQGRTPPDLKVLSALKKRIASDDLKAAEGTTYP